MGKRNFKSKVEKGDNLVMNDENEMRGITLIALVITIIVLLILTAVSIATLIGENGLITKATYTKEITTISTLKEELDLYKLNYDNQKIDADKEKIYIDGNEQEGDIYTILTSLKNSKYDNNIVIKNGKIHIDNLSLVLSNEIKQYIYDNLEDFYLVEYDMEDKWKIEIVNEEEKTCLLNSIYTKGIENGFLRLPDYVKKEGVYYKVIGNNVDILDDGVEVTKLFIPETFKEFNRLKRLFVNDTYLREIYVEDGLEILGYGAFGCARNLTSIRLPNTLKSIGGACFFEDKKLESISLPENLEKISEQAFAGTGISQITIPKSVKQLGAQIFQNCQNLKKVVFLNECSTMPRGTFLNSTTEKVEFPSKVIEIAESGMAAANFKEIDLPNGIEKLGNNCFENNYNLEKVRIPNTVQEIGEKIFSFTNIIIYTDNQIFINYMNEKYPEKVTIKSYNEW